MSDAANQLGDKAKWGAAVSQIMQSERAETSAFALEMGGEAILSGKLRVQMINMLNKLPDAVDTGRIALLTC